MKQHAKVLWQRWLPALLLLLGGALVFRAWLSSEHIAAWLQLLSLCS
jgi:hypothetical protein